MKKISSKQLAQAVTALKQGGVVLLPTESSYGLCTPVRSRAGVRRILKIKQRRDAKFTVVAASLAQAQAFFSVARRPGWARVARKVWPGSVSLVVNQRFSVRVPDSPLLRKIAQQVGQPLIATSANVAGRTPAFSIAEARRQLDLAELDAVVDGGKLPSRQPSAVVKVTRHGIDVLRAGSPRMNRVLKQLSNSVHVHTSFATQGMRTHVYSQL